MEPRTLLFSLAATTREKLFELIITTMLPRMGLITEKVPFTVKEVSQFRLFCEAPDADNNIDVDFHLLEDGHTVASSISTKQEEEITYTLQPGKAYALSVYHFLPFAEVPKCLSYSLELSISPFDNNPHFCNGQEGHLPPTDLMYVLPHTAETHRP